MIRWKADGLVEARSMFPVQAMAIAFQKSCRRRAGTSVNAQTKQVVSEPII